jgi:hypothetical protein
MQGAEIKSYLVDFLCRGFTAVLALRPRPVEGAERLKHATYYTDQLRDKDGGIQ